PHSFSVGNAARPGIGRIHLEKICLFHLLHRRLVAESGVHVVIGLARQKFERKTGWLFSLNTMPRLLRRRELCHWIKSQRLHRLAVKFSLARRRTKVAACKRKKGLCIAILLYRRLSAGSREIQSHLPLPLQSLAADSLQVGILPRQRAVNHLIDALGKTFVSESHARCQGPEDLDIGPALSQRLNRLFGNLQVIVAVSCLQILVLEKRSR